MLLSHIEASSDATDPRQAMTLQETEWVKAAQQDLRYFEPLYTRYYRQIYEYIYRRCDDAESCLDITSLVFEKAMLNIGKYRIQGFPFGSWLYRIAASEIGNYYRRQKKERKVWVRTDGIRDIAQEIDSTHEDEENLQILLKTLQDMKPEETELIVMRYFEKRSFSEIGDILDCTEANARVRIHRVMQKMRVKFGKGVQP